MTTKQKPESSIRLCSAVCGITDELRDQWLSRQSDSDFKAIMSLTVSQQRMSRAVRRMTQDKPDGITLKELADKLALSSSAVSVMVESMVKKNMLERTTSPHDRRMVMIRISELGRKRIRMYESYFGELVNEFLNEFPQEKRDEIVDFMEQFHAFMARKSSAVKPQ